MEEIHKPESDKERTMEGKFTCCYITMGSEGPNRDLCYYQPQREIGKFMARGVSIELLGGT
jgi:hypothetical protein